MLHFIDIPRIHNFTDNDNEDDSNEMDYNLSEKVFEQLAETNNMQLLEQELFIRLIEFKWPLILKYILRRLFFP